MEQEIIGLISSHHQAIFSEKSHKYFNVLEKLRNVKVGDQVAWNEFQPILEYCVEGYPTDFQDLQAIIRNIFQIRRGAFIGDLKVTDATALIRQTLSSLDENEQGLLDAPMVCIRDLFDINRQRGKSRI